MARSTAKRKAAGKTGRGTKKPRYPKLDVVRRLRKRLDKSRADLARDLGLTEQTIVCYELGYRRPSLEAAWDIVRLGRENQMRISLAAVLPDPKVMGDDQSTD